MISSSNDFPEAWKSLSEPLFVFLLKYPYISTLKTDVSLLGPLDRTLSSQYGFLKNTLLLDEQKSKRRGELSKVSSMAGEFAFYTKKKKTILLSILYHLRNAFAHGLIEDQSPYILLRDYPFNKQTGRISYSCPNAYIKIKVSDLCNFLNQINQ